jgi:hypothetical protein
MTSPISDEAQLLDFWSEQEGNPFPRGSRMARRRAKTVRTKRRVEVLRLIARISREDVFAQLLGFTLSRPKSKNPGAWAVNLFAELFGVQPWAWRKTVKPQSPSSVVLDWLALRPKWKPARSVNRPHPRSRDQ